MYPTDDIINLADAYAKNSEHKFRVGAVIYWRKHIVSAGFNNAIKTHPKSPHPFKTIHAEFAAVLDAARDYGNDLGGHSIYVRRILLDNTPALAKPCEWCMKMLSQVGISDIHWSK